MKAVLGSFQDTLVKGVFVLVPIMVFGLLIAKAIGCMKGMGERALLRGKL